MAFRLLLTNSNLGARSLREKALKIILKSRPLPVGDVEELVDYNLKATNAYGYFNSDGILNKIETAFGVSLLISFIASL